MLAGIPHMLPDEGSPADMSSWTEYRFRARLFWAALLLGLVATLAIASLLLVERLGLHGIVWPLLLWALAVLAAGLYWQGFRCPRCAKRFFRSSPPLLALRRERCVNCMLPKE